MGRAVDRAYVAPNDPGPGSTRWRRMAYDIIHHFPGDTTAQNEA
jgi:hypothetical protein